MTAIFKTVASTNPCCYGDAKN